jgi:hypothetical protein
VLLFAWAAPALWKKTEPFPTGPDYRIPYALSKDYWLYQRRLKQVADPNRIPVLGDSVVWGEYVRPDGTLSHFLNRQAGAGGNDGDGDRFINCGVNGLFPLALEGLVDGYGATLHHRKIIIQCNPLWLTSPKADLSATKEEKFNHSRLVPQFSLRIPCYRADSSERISAVLDREIGYFAWVGHLQNAYYDQKSIPQWTLETDGAAEPPTYANAWRNPLSPLRQGIPTEPANDEQRGPTSPRHKPWDTGGAEPMAFEWVPLGRSLQWQAFQRLTLRLRDRHNEVLVLVGPFNEHMIAPEQRPAYRAIRDAMAAWLAGNGGVTVVAPQPLASRLYADASHPLTEGYSVLAEEVYGDPAFKQWLARP